MTHISVIISIYRCEDSILELYERLGKALTEISPEYEIIFVNDASPENDWELIQDICKKDKKVKALNFSRNFGQHYAIAAGLSHAAGEWVVVMDGDLEDTPEDITKLYNQAQTGYDIVYADYKENIKPILIRNFSRLYHKLFNFLANNTEEKGNARFVILNKVVVDNFNKLENRQVHFGPLLHSLGFKDFKLPLDPQKVENKSSYTFTKKLNLAINSIISHSTILLRVSIAIGFFFSLCAFLFGTYVIIQKISGIQVKLGWSSIITSIYFVSGLIMIVAGILGMYIESIIYEVKGTPRYIIKETLNF